MPIIDKLAAQTQQVQTLVPIIHLMGPQAIKLCPTHKRPQQCKVQEAGQLSTPQSSKVKK